MSTVVTKYKNMIQLIKMAGLVFLFVLSTNAVNISSVNAAKSFDDRLSAIEQKLERMGLKRTGNVTKSKASWYGPGFHGRTTANMEIFDKNKISAAHKTLPINSYVLVTNLDNQKQLVVRINDRGPYIKGRDIDLSEAAAIAIGSIKHGVVPIEYEVLVPEAQKKEEQTEEAVEVVAEAEAVES